MVLVLVYVSEVIVILYLYCIVYLLSVIYGFFFGVRGRDCYNLYVLYLNMMESIEMGSKRKRNSILEKSKVLVKDVIVEGCVENWLR